MHRKSFSVGITTKLLAFVLIAVLSGVNYAAAPINVDDPDLRLWLDAEVLEPVDSNGILTWNVPVWIDSSQHATEFKAISDSDWFCAPEWRTDPENHTPLLVTVNNYGKTFQAVQFRQACDPIVPEIGCGIPDPNDPNGVIPSHLSDRLVQNNNFSPDPTNIDVDKDITLIIVLRDDAMDAVIGPYQSVIAKRGPSGCPWQLMYQPGDKGFSWESYNGGPTLSEFRAVQSVWSIVEATNLTDGTLLWREFYQGIGWKNSVTFKPRAGLADAGIPCMLSGMAQGIGATPENPLGNGAGERYLGLIAEVMLFSRTLEDSERADIEAYLVDKYFPRWCGDYATTKLFGDLNGDCESDILDLKVFASNWLSCSDPANTLCDTYWR